jgi:hypothetical protein
MWYVAELVHQYEMEDEALVNSLAWSNDLMLCEVNRIEMSSRLAEDAKQELGTVPMYLQKSMSRETERFGAKYNDWAMFVQLVCGGKNVAGPATLPEQREQFEEAISSVVQKLGISLSEVDGKDVLRARQVSELAAEIADRAQRMDIGKFDKKEWERSYRDFGDAIEALRQDRTAIIARYREALRKHAEREEH